MTPSMQNPAYWEGGDLPWVSSGDVKVSRLNDTSQHATSLAVRCGAAIVVPAASILLVTRSGILRKYLPVALAVRPMAINQDIKALIPNGAVSADFLLHSLIGFGDKILASCLKAGTTVESVEFPWLKAFTVPIPPREEQDAIARVLSDFDAELEALEARRHKTRALKQAMVQELLTGRTRLAGHGVKARPSAVRAPERRANVHFKRSVLAAEIVDRLHTEATFGHVKLEKVIFLVERMCKVDTGSTYHRDAAGPYDNRALRSIDAQLLKQKWFAAEKVERRYRYAPLEKRGEHKPYFDRYFSDIGDLFDKIISTFKTFDTERCEIVATLFGAWEDLARQSMAVTDDAILHEVLTQWHESKKRIPEERWLKALGWMRKNGFVPEVASDA